MPNFVIEHTKEDHTQITSRYLLDGALAFAKSKPDSTWYKLIHSFSSEFKRLESQINETNQEVYPEETESLISRWEKDLGFPNDVFDIADTLEQRRNNVIIWLTALGVQTADDFIALANLLGYSTIEIVAGTDAGGFALPFPFTFFSTSKAAFNTIIVRLDSDLVESQFPMQWPYPFSSFDIGIIQRLFERLKPATDKVIFKFDL